MDYKNRRKVLMIELTFSENAAGGLKLASSCKPGRNEARRPHILMGAPPDGGGADVYCLTLALDMGSLADMDAGMETRKEALEELFGQFPGVSGELWRQNTRALARLREAEQTHEPVRVWVQETNPAELCGLYYLCHRLRHTAVPLIEVRVPGRLSDGDSDIWIGSVGELEPERFGALAKTHGQTLGEQERGACAAQWRALAAQNAPLRAVVNGRIAGVPVDFYDYALRANLPEGAFKAALLLGRTLGSLPGVSDRWLYLRLQAMLEAGELIEIAPASDDHPYSAVIRRPAGGADAAGPGRPVPAIDHIHITVEDLARAERFYDRLLPLLGFDTSLKEHDSVPAHAYHIVEYHNPKFSIGLVDCREAYAGQAVSRRRPGALHHLAFFVESRSRVDELYAAVLALGAPVVHAPQTYPEYCADYYAFFFKDTEGIELEIVHWSASGAGTLTRRP